MAEININGQLCLFPSVPHAVLTSYNNGLGVSPRTTILAWKRAHPTHQVAFLSMLQSLHELGGVELPPYIVEDSTARTIILLENPNKTMMQHVIDWIGSCVGLHYFYRCPYRDKLAEEIRHGDERIKDIDMWLSYHKHPLYLEWKRQQTAGTAIKIAPDTPADFATRKNYQTSII